MSTHGMDRDYLFAALINGDRMSPETATAALESFAAKVILEHTAKGGCDAMVREWQQQREPRRG